MIITIEINELLKIVRESAKVGSIINRVKATTITKKALIEKLEKGAVEMREQTDAIIINIVDDVVLIDIDTDFIVELIKVYGDAIKGVVSIVTGFEGKFNGLFQKWSKTKQ